MSKLERTLEDCLVRLVSGEATLEDCLASYPEHAEELRRSLTAIRYMERGRGVSPSPAFKARTRARLITHINTRSRRRPAAQRTTIRPLLGFYLVFVRVFKLAFSAAPLLLLFLMTGTVLAQTALPGDALYGWRVTSERVWRSLHLNPIKADLTLAERHARDLIQVAGDPEAEPLARRDYEQTLNDLSAHRPLPELISQPLAQQKAQLEQVDVDVPKLDELLAAANPPETRLTLAYQATAAEAGRITYSLTITNNGPTSPVTATVVSRLSPLETLVTTGEPTCARSADEALTCTVANITTNTPRRLTLTTAVPPCYSGLITNTVSVTGTDKVVNTNPDNQAVAETRVAVSFLGPARMVYVQSGGRRHDLVGAVVSTAPPLTDNLQLHAGAPAWSPDGRQLAFFGEEGISELDGIYRQGNGVWLMDIVNGQAQPPRLIVDQDHVKNMTWSPDGTKLAFEVGPPGQRREIVVVDPRDGHQISRFAGEQPAWRPDSQKLVMTACIEDCGLWQVNFDGSGAEQLTFGDSDSYPAWSPGGEYLVFASARQGDWEIYRLRPADGELVRLTDRPGSDTTPVFGRCGEIYIRTDAYGDWRITVMKLDGSDETTVVEGVGESDDWGLARPAVH